MKAIQRLGGAATLCTMLLGASSAHAGDEEEISAAVAIASLAAVDISFSVRAAVLANSGGDVESDYSLAQSIVSIPQAVMFNAAIIALMSDNDAPEAFAALHIPATMTTALAIHGLWSLSSPDEDQKLMFFASTALGVNTMWTSFSLGSAFSGRDRLDDGAPPIGVYQVVTTLPGVALGIHQTLETDRFKTGWISIASWSGLLSIHGFLLATEIIEYDDDDNWAASAPIKHVGLAPTSLGAPVEGAPDTPGLILSGVF